MAVPVATADLLALIRKSDLELTDRLDGFLQQHPQLPETAAGAAQTLQEGGVLTPFQAKLLLAGKYRGFRLGPYRLVAPIGAGGTSSVYLGEHIDLRRRAALKVLPAQQANDADTLERFYREARAVAALDHPNIVRAFDIDRAGPVHFLVVEYVEGHDLEALVRKQGPLPVAQAVGYTMQAASGLHHAYETGLIHRDIKPANLLLDNRGVVKLIDLGLARFFDEKQGLTEKLDKGVFLGTVDFMAPEQALDSGTVDIRADIYSLGATLYYLLIGQPPFTGNTTQKLSQHQIKPPPSAHAVRAEVPPALADVIVRMMAKEPDERLQTPAEVVLALAEWAPELPAGSTARLPRLPAAPLSAVPTSSPAKSGVQARPGPAPATQIAPRSRSRRWLIGAGALVAGGAGLAAWRFWPASKPPVTPDAGLLYRLDLSQQGLFTQQVKGKSGSPIAEGGIPPTWSAFTLDPNTEMEWGVEPVDTRTGIVIRHVKGKPPAVVRIAGPTLSAGWGYLLQIDYRCRDKAHGSLRYALGDKPPRPLLWLAPTNDIWQRVEVLLGLPESGPLHLEVALSAEATRAFPLCFRSLELWQAPPARGSAIYRLRLPKKETAFIKLKGSTVEEKKTPEHWPAEWQQRVNQPGTVGEFRLEQVDGTPELRLRTPAGTGRSEIHSAGLLCTLLPQQVYHLMVEYRTLGPGQGGILVRALDQPFPALHLELPPTDGKWQLAGLVLRPTKEMPIRVSVENKTSGGDKTLCLRALEVLPVLG